MDMSQQTAWIAPLKDHSVTVASQTPRCQLSLVGLYSICNAHKVIVQPAADEIVPNCPEAIGIPHFCVRQEEFLGIYCHERNEPCLDKRQGVSSEDRETLWKASIFGANLALWHLTLGFLYFSREDWIPHFWDGWTFHNLFLFMLLLLLLLLLWFFVDRFEAKHADVLSVLISQVWSFHLAALSYRPLLLYAFYAMCERP